MEFFW
jgi:hypothetical protein